jgi:hypothetical protein
LSDRERKLRETTDLTPVYLSQIVNYIEAKIEDQTIKNMMLQRVKKYPHSALKNFFSRFESILTDCIKVYSERKNKEFLIKEKKIEQIPAIAKQDILELQEQLEQEILSEAKDDQKNS